MPLPSLPTEVIENVIDQATFDTQTLRGFALSCRDLLPRSRYHLYHSIRFQDTTQLDSFYIFLNSHPHVAPFVVSLTLSATEYAPYRTSRWLLQIIPTRLFQILPSLCVWTITDPGWDNTFRKPLFFSFPTIACLKAHGTVISELHLDSINLQNCAHFADYILAFRGLKVLHCRYINFEKNFDNLRLYRVKERLAKQLRLSTLIIGNDVPDDAAGALLQSSPSTLLHLELRVPRSTRLNIPTIVSELHGLRSLTLVLNHTGGWPSYTARGELTDIVLRAFHIIKELCLHPQSRLHTLAVHCHRILLFLDPLFNPDSYPALESCRELEAILLRLSTLRNIQVQYNVEYELDLMPLVEQYLPTLVRQRSVTVNRLQPSSHRQQPNHDSYVTAISVSPDSRWIASGSSDGTIILWDAQRRSIIHEWTAHSDRVRSLAFSPDSRLLASGGRDGKVMVWDISGLRVKKVAALEGHSSVVRSCAWSPDGTTLVSGSHDETVRIWDSRTYQQCHSLHDPSGKLVKFVRFSPDGRWIASGGHESTSCAIWDAATGDLHVALGGHSESLSNAVFDLATGRIVTASYDHTVRIWDIKTGPEALLVLEGHTDWVRDVAFSPDGRRVVSGSRDRTVKVWDSFSGELLLSLEAHTDRVYVVCFSPDGKYIASASGDGTVRLWRVNDGVCIRTLNEHTGYISLLVYSPDGETLTSCGRDGMVCIRRICNVIPDSERSEADGLIM